MQCGSGRQGSVYLWEAGPGGKNSMNITELCSARPRFPLDYKTIVIPKHVTKEAGRSGEGSLVLKYRIFFPKPSTDFAVLIRKYTFGTLTSNVLKKFSILSVCVITILLLIMFIWQLVKWEIRPALAMWLMFSAAVIMSMIT
jgi:hypothetical protein